jgi:hypothetical protein
MTASDAPVWLAVAGSLLPIALGVTGIAACFVAFIHWVDRLAAADKFAHDFIPECVDVAAVEAALPDMRNNERRTA